MRRLIVTNIMSIDGFHEGPDKNVLDVFAYRFGAYPTDDSFDAYCAERLREADSLLVGLTTYEQLKEYWPSVVNDPKASSTEHAISARINEIEKIVVSDGLREERTDPWRQTTRIVRRTNARSEIAKLKRKAGKEILVVGSRTLWNDLLAHALVDELHLIVSPSVVGGGTPLFDAASKPTLRLLDSRTWKDSGNLLIRYEVVSKK